MKNILFIFCIFCNFLAAQTNINPKIEIGGRYKKYAGFYAVNGISANLLSPFSKNESVYYGLNVGSSLLGSALNTNALTTYEVELTATKFYRVNKIFQPLLRFNIGTVKVSFGDDADLFKALPSWGLITSIETGIGIHLRKIHPNLKSQITGGIHLYNTGPGVVYPVYGSLQLLWRL